jgi:predicted MFS family arabinose efflux permease
LGRSLAIFIYALCVFFKILDNIFLLGIFLGLFGSFFMPSAVPFITSIVDEKDLPRANATIDMIYELGIVIGMGLSGIFILKMGNLLTLVIGGIGFVLAGYFNYLMEYKQFNKKKTEVTSSAITDYIKAISYVKQEKKLLKVYLIQSFINVMIMTIPVLLLPFVVNILQADNSTFSVFELIHSLGIFIGYIFIPIIYDSLGFKKTAITFLSTIFLALASIYINPNTSLNVIAYFFVGFGLSIWGISISEAQKVTHVNLQGRVQSLFDGLSGIIVLILYLLITFYGNTLNIRTLFLVEAIVALSTIVISMICRGVVAQKN